MKKILILLLLFCTSVNLQATDYSYDNPFFVDETTEPTLNPNSALPPVSEQDSNTESPTHTFKGSVSFVTDYRFRGISQTMRQPAVQGTLDYSHISGFYLGTFGSNVDGTTHYYNDTSLEWDFYAGFKGKVFPESMPHLVYNVGAIYYFYPGGETGLPHSVRYNTAEFYIELGYEWVNVRYWQTLTNYFGFCNQYTPYNWHEGDADPARGNSKGSVYIETNLNFELCGKWFTQVHLGRQTVRHYRHMNYLDWKLMLSKEFDWFTVFAYYVGTNANSQYYNVPDNQFNEKVRSLTANGVVFGITRSL